MENVYERFSLPQMQYLHESPEMAGLTPKSSYEERAIKEENPTYEELKEWYTKSGLPLKKFFNTSGMI